MYLKEELYELIRTDERIFDFIQDSSLDGLWYWDLENPENEWMNSRFWTTLGYNPDEMPNKSSAWQSIINQDDLKIAMDNFTKHCENPDHPYDQIVRYAHKNGSTVWIRCRGLAIRDDNGKPRRMLGAHHDITENKRKEQELLEIEQRSSVLLENSPICTKIVDLNFNLQYMSQSGIKELKIDDITQFYGKPYPLYFYPDSFKILMTKNLKEAKETGKIITQEASIVDTTGRTLWYHSTIVPVFNNNKEIDYIMVVSMETTKRKEVELELIQSKEKAEESEEKYRALFINAPLSYQSLDEDGCFLDVNPMWLRTLGYERNEVIGKWYGDFLHQDYVEHFRINFPAFKKRGYVSDVQFRLRKKDNSFIHVSFEGCIGYTPDGSFKQTYCVFKDITEQKALEEALIKSKERAEESEEKYKLLYENAGVGIGYYSPEGKVISFNQIAAKHLNGNPEDFIGKSIFDMFPKPDAEFYFNRIQNAIHAKEQVVYEDFIQLPKEEKWFLSTFTKIVDSQNKVIGIQIISQDITKLKSTEIELLTAKERAEESEERYSGLLTNLETGVVVHAGDSSVILCNSRSSELLGLSEEQMKGKTAIDSAWRFIYEDNQPIPSSDFPVMRIINSKKAIRNQIFGVCRTKDEISWLVVNGYPVTKESGEISEIIISFIDITERKLAEQELIKSKEKAVENEKQYHDLYTLMRLMSDTMPDMLWAKDLNKKFIFANKAICERLLSAVDTQEPIGKSDLFFAIRERELHSEETNWHTFGEICADSDSIVLQNMKKMQFDEYGNVKNKFLFLDVHKAPLYNVEGELIGIVGSARDVTFQKQAEKELIQSKERAEESERRVRSMFSSSNSGFVVIDLNGRLIEWNSTFESYFGYERDEFEKLSTKELTYPDDLAASLDNIYKIKTNQIENFRIEKRFVRKDKSVFWVDLFASPLKRESTVIALLGVVNDISDRKSYESELVLAKEKAEESEERLIIQKSEIELNHNRLESLLKISQFQTNSIQELLDFALQEAVSLTDSKIGYIYFYNEEKEHFILNSWSKDVMKECTVLEPRTIYDLDQTGCWGEAVRQRKPIIINDFPAENPLKRGTPQGHIKLEKFLTIPVIVDNKIVAVAGVANKVNDYDNSDVRQISLLMDSVWKISERIGLIKDLTNAKERAEESDKLKTAFLQNMSHEIRTPLNGILGFSNLLQDDYLEKEEIKEYTAIISQSGHRLLEIINNVLDISKIETGQMVLQNSDFSLNSMISRLFSFFAPFAEAKNIKLRYKFSMDNSNSQIISDETKLNQILNNLINNAIKFTFEGSIDFGYELVNKELLFYVKDTGMGIPPEYHDRIFNRFTQVDLEITRGFEGAGLGLSISKGLVELLGGKMWFESEIGKGTTFFFTIPYSPSDIVAKENLLLVDETELTKKIKILIAEDDYTSFIYLSKVVKEKDFILILAENGQKAVDYVKNNSDIDLVLMDIRMPVMDGFEATKLIKSIRPDLPIIAQTAYAFNEERDKILAAGCDDYLSKPIESDKLLQMINKSVRI